MSLSDDMRGFREAWHPQHGPSCRVGILVEMMDPEDQGAFQDLLDSQIYGTDISLMVKAWNDREDLSESFRHAAATISPTGIQRHRRRACHCQWTEAS